MKRLICTFLAAGVLCSFGGCQEKGLPRPDFPLEEAVITAALEQTGLPRVISESETQSNVEGHMAYVLRHPTASYGDSENKRMTAAISSAVTEGERFLSIFFESVTGLNDGKPGKPFAWEDWKQQFVFAALLYGGFTDDEAIYRAFSGKAASEGELPPPTYEEGRMTAERFAWDAQLPAGGYCRVSYRLDNASSDRSDNPEQFPRMTVSVYESESLYQKMQQEGAAAKEAADRARSEAGK